MFCSVCGHQKLEDERYCTRCGEAFSSEDIGLESKHEHVNEQKSYNKIGGWLLVVGLGLIVAPFFHAYAAIDSVSLLIDESLRPFYTLIPGLRSGIWFELILDTALIFASVFLLYLFKGMKKAFRWFYVVYLIVLVLYLIADLAIFASLSIPNNQELEMIFESNLEDALATLTSSIITGAIWITYMLRSKRVAGTFIK